MHNIIGILGSLRTPSSNSKIIQTIAGLSTEVSLIISNIFGDLPHFNPDIDKDKTPDIVKTWREQIKNADGVIICTPEYALGVPGVLKNALDWLVSSGEFVNKPTIVISASPMETGGDKAHDSLLLTLNMMTAKIVEGGNLIMPFINQKINKEGKITDNETVNQLQSSLNELIKEIEQKCIEIGI